jgi:magnesium-transporting ATPase (P-type)
VVFVIIVTHELFTYIHIHAQNITGVSAAVDTCLTAGIQVMMITGDHPLTAESIAREVHIIRGRTKGQAAKEMGIPEEEVRADLYDAVVLHGEALSVMNEDQWAEASYTASPLYSIATVVTHTACYTLPTRCTLL